MPRWLLVEPMNGHHGKELINGPRVRHGLKKGKVREVDIGKHSIKTPNVLRIISNQHRHVTDPMTDSKIKVLCCHPLLQG